MRPTRRTRTIAGLCCVLALLAVVLSRPLLLVGVAGLCALLLVQGYQFARATANAESLTITQSASRSRTMVDEPTTVSLRASLPTDQPLRVDVALDRPPSARITGSTTCSIEAGARRASLHVAAAGAVAGTLRFDSPRVTFTDPNGLFTETVTRGDPLSVTVETRGPRRVHVGQGGTPAIAEYGEHASGRQGVGIDPTELRQYVAGDDLSRIDWKATARLNRPHIREYETTTARRTLFVFDHRSGIGAGPAGETKLDYLREVALGMLAHAESFDDPSGLYAIGDGGITAAVAPSAEPNRIARLQALLLDLRPTARGPQTDAPARDGTDGESSDRHVSADPYDRLGRTRRVARALASEETAYARTLAPYLQATHAYVHQVEDRPLFRAVTRYVARQPGNTWTVICTDDARRGELFEAVKVARQRDRHVLVFLAPSVFFEAGVLDDVDRAYERYRDFERFRAALARFGRVEAYEVTPGARLETILGAGRARSAEPAAPRGEVES